MKNSEKHKIICTKLVCPVCSHTEDFLDPSFTIETDGKIKPYCVPCYAHFLAKNIPQMVEKEQSSNLTVTISEDK